MKIWTEKENADLVDLFAQKLSFGQIAIKMGKKRNAVIGRAHRMKLIQTPDPKKTLQEQVQDLWQRGWSYSKIEEKLGQKVSMEIRGMLSGTYRGYGFKRSKTSAPDGKKYFSKVNFGFTKTLEEIGPRDCRFVEGDGPFYFCGEKVNGYGSYCDRCTKIAYRVSGKSDD